MYPDIRLYRHGVYIESYEGDRSAGTIVSKCNKQKLCSELSLKVRYLKIKNVASDCHHVGAFKFLL